ncbi:MAG: septation protein SepH, partial [Actinomycetota bacterium]|nr:septation protein SepH [Actinomycetota bacterium]
MKELHLVGLTADRDGLILAARKGGKSGGFKIVLDEDLLDHIDELRDELGLSASGARRHGSAPRRLRSALSPREIQARLRVGSTVEEVAEEAGVDASWVERFAVPVLAEQNDAIDRATRLTVTTPRRGTSDRPLVDAVALNLADRGVRLPESAADAGWSAYHHHGSQWNLTFTFRQRGRLLRAEWRADLAEGTLVCENRLAADLGFTGPGGSHPARPDAGEQAEALAASRAGSARQVSTTG